MKLVIVESPAKARTIERYLGEDFKVAATLGHVKDLPKSKLGVDVEKNFKPQYEVMPGKSKVVRDLKKKLPKNERDVFLALDPDREGEAIAEHVAEVLKLKSPNRVVFHEVTKDAILDAIENPRKISKDLVDAQKARRVLDRLVGYELSGLLWKKIWYGLSAGRVQSVANRLIVERERERDAFKPEEYWDVLAHLITKKKKKAVAKLAKKDGKKFVPGSKKETDGVLKDLDGADWKVAKLESKDRKRRPSPPYTTSTLQQSANNYLGYRSGRTMQLAQQLYQGVKIKGKGQVGLITYMRTDSTYLSSQAVKAMRGVIGSTFGKEYMPGKPIFYKTKSKLAQEAHEAIRPTDFNLDPESVKGSLTPQQYKLYKLIWNRALASQMVPMEFEEKKADIEATCKNKDRTAYLFNLKAHQIKFDGFARLMGAVLIKEDGAQEIGELEEGDKLDCEKIETKQNFTKPRARYTEATLVKALEKYGIGRPSTYASIISTIQSRGYVGRDGRYLFPTDVGIVVNDFLVEHFEDIVDYEFTSGVEEELDDIALGEQEWVPVVEEVYVPFDKTLKEKEKSVKKEDVVILGDSKKKCPECKGKMVKRLGRDGVFLSCAKFPECKGMLGIDGKTMEESIDTKKYEKPEKCEKCGGKMVPKKGRYGMFWACSKYPACKNAQPLLLKEKCPECGESLVERMGKWGKPFTGCSGYPKCKYIKKVPKKDEDARESGSSEKATKSVTKKSATKK